jgi:hypothetical protein
MRTTRTALVLAGLFLWQAPTALASNRLLFFEAQAVLGYSSQDDLIFHSISREDAMQKSSLGFDYIQRLTGSRGDYGMLAVQGRLAYDPDAPNELEAQLYNAYVQYKAGWSDLWLGHNRPALGLSSVLDTHALLLPALPMYGFGFEQDWGLGATRDLFWGDVAFSLTTGSGMPLRFKGNYLASARVSKGILNQDNWNIGLSLAHGETLKSMGYHLMHSATHTLALAGLDATYFWDNYEARFEVMGGTQQDEDALALFLRLGVNLLDEGRLTLELQPGYTKIGRHEHVQFAAGPSYKLNSRVTLRALYAYDDMRDDHRAVLQFYYYTKVL